MHQLDNLNTLLREYWGDRSRQGRTDHTGRALDAEAIGVPLILTLAIGGLGIYLFRTLSTQK